MGRDNTPLALPVRCASVSRNEQQQSVYELHGQVRRSQFENDLCYLDQQSHVDEHRPRGVLLPAVCNEPAGRPPETSPKEAVRLSTQNLSPPAEIVQPQPDCKSVHDTLNATDKALLKRLREVRYSKGQSLANHIGRSPEYTRARLARLKKLGRIGNDTAKGYYLLRKSKK
jgi:hypothetical protein